MTAAERKRLQREREKSGIAWIPEHLTPTERKRKQRLKTTGVQGDTQIKTIAQAQQQDRAIDRCCVLTATGKRCKTAFDLYYVKNGVYACKKHIDDAELGKVQYLIIPE